MLRIFSSPFPAANLTSRLSPAIRGFVLLLSSLSSANQPPSHASFLCLLAFCLHSLSEHLTINMSAAFALCLLLLFVIKAAQGSALFDPIDSSFVRFGKIKSCASVTLHTLPFTDPLSCAVACGVDPRCRAMFHDRASLRCLLLDTPCSMPSTEDTHRVMVRRQQLSQPTWSFKESKYILTTTKGSFAEMQEECARFGMYVWIPNTQEELTFVQNKGFGLPSQYKQVISPTLTNIKVWIGVMDRPNGNCLLPDLATKCPVTNYDVAHDEPYRNVDECTNFWSRNGTIFWNDITCDTKYYAICEGQ